MARSGRVFYSRLLLVAMTIIVLPRIAFVWEATTGLTIATRRVPLQTTHSCLGRARHRSEGHIGFGRTFDESRMEKLEAGSFAIIPGGTPHYVLTRDETIIQVHGPGPAGLTFVTPEDHSK